MRATFCLFLTLAPAAAGAQTLLYKCVDAQKAVTYSNITCEKQGLKDAGTVADRVTSMPFNAPPKPAPRVEPAKEAGKDAAKDPADPNKK
ncbi:MAG TPA: DUF4124 domain-containing protein [Burkholderiales bacterium]|nr:DUF4124 domain-containing protein [Burkholderiales bacterium]